MHQALKQKDTKEPAIFIELGRLYRMIGDKNNEQKIYLQGLEQSPKNIILMLNLASNHEINQAFDDAIALYEKVLLINPQHNVSKNNLATVLLDHYGKTDDLNKAIQLTESFKQSNQPYFLDTYGWAKLKSGKTAEALSIFKQVILLEPNTLIFRYHLAVAYYNLGNLMSAGAELKQALYLGKGEEFSEKVLIKNLLVKIKDK
ncbi:MAG: tetratricopeptide repeat protein [Methylomarinum sp.]|nr:tetratricopeptide repeat protein [Methylomarinum sp.]